MAKSPDEPFRRVKVVTSMQRRRRWSVAEKVRLVDEAMRPGMSVSYVAGRAGIAPSQLFAWKRRYHRRIEMGVLDAVLADLLERS
jgi:transposase